MNIAETNHNKVKYTFVSFIFSFNEFFSDFHRNIEYYLLHRQLKIELFNEDVSNLEEKKWVSLFFHKIEKKK